MCMTVLLPYVRSVLHVNNISSSDFSFGSVLRDEASRITPGMTATRRLNNAQAVALQETVRVDTAEAHPKTDSQEGKLIQRH